MGMYEGRGGLAKAVKDLNNAWASARASWDDAQARAFEETYLVPMQQDLRAAVGAMDLMATVIGRVRTECSSNEE